MAGGGASGRCRRSEGPLAKAPIIGAEAVKVHMQEPVMIDQAPPTVKNWGPYRMPEVYRLPGGELNCSLRLNGTNPARPSGHLFP